MTESKIVIRCQEGIYKKILAALAKDEKGFYEPSRKFIDVSRIRVTPIYTLYWDYTAWWGDVPNEILKILTDAREEYVEHMSDRKIYEDGMSFRYVRLYEDREYYPDFVELDPEYEIDEPEITISLEDSGAELK